MKDTDPIFQHYKELFTVTEEQFDKQLQMHREFIETKELPDKPKCLAPAIWVLARDVEGNAKLDAHIIATHFNTDEEKKAIMSALGKRYCKEQLIPALVTMSTEAWVSTGSMEDRTNLQRHLPPSMDPHKREGIIIFAATMYKPRRGMIVIPVRRDENDQMIRDGDHIKYGTDGPQRVCSTGILDLFFRAFIETVAVGAQRQ